MAPRRTYWDQLLTETIRLKRGPAEKLVTLRDATKFRTPDLYPTSRILSGHQFVNQAQLGTRKNGFGVVDLSTEMSDRFVRRCVGEWVKTNGEGLGLQVWHNIDLSIVDGAQQASCIVMTRHLLTDYLRHGCLSPIGDHFDGVDEVLALRA